MMAPIRRLAVNIPISLRAPILRGFRNFGIFPCEYPVKAGISCIDPTGRLHTMQPSHRQGAPDIRFGARPT
jgi:hypothetical protein